MKGVYLYLLLGVFLYFVLTKVLDNYLRKQENFDPSLVPVSSIVTLAKVAQKLVNGNGTLTNPGNLQIGAGTSTPGNLTVTGNSVVSGTSTVGGDTTIGGALITGTASGTNYIKGTTNMNAVNANSIGVTGNTTIGGTLGVTGATTLSSTLGVSGATTVGDTLGVTGATTLSSLTTNGNTTVGNNLTIKGNGSNAILINARNNSGITQIVSDTAATGIRFYSNVGGKYTLESNSNGDLNITGKLRFNGKPAMVFKDFSGSDLGWNNDYGWIYNTGISGDYQAAIGWWRGTFRWESYYAWLAFIGESWHFVINNVRDGNYTRSEIINIRVYGYHNNML